MQIVTLTISHTFARHTCDIYSFKLKPRHGLKYTYFECQSIVWIFQIKVFCVPPQNPAVADVLVHPGTKGTKLQFMASSKKFKDLPGTLWGRWDKIDSLDL